LRNQSRSEPRLASDPPRLKLGAFATFESARPVGFTVHAIISRFVLFTQDAPWALALTWDRTGSSPPARTAMAAEKAKSSTRWNAPRRGVGIGVFFRRETPIFREGIFWGRFQVVFGTDNLGPTAQDGLGGGRIRLAWIVLATNRADAAWISQWILPNLVARLKSGEPGTCSLVEQNDNKEALAGNLAELEAVDRASIILAIRPSQGASQCVAQATTDRKGESPVLNANRLFRRQASPRPFHCALRPSPRKLPESLTV
jgi:hypothetical protein